MKLKNLFPFTVQELKDGTQEVIDDENPAYTYIGNIRRKTFSLLDLREKEEYFKLSVSEREKYLIDKAVNRF